MLSRYSQYYRAYLNITSTLKDFLYIFRFLAPLIEKPQQPDTKCLWILTLRCVVSSFILSLLESGRIWWHMFTGHQLSRDVIMAVQSAREADIDIVWLVGI